MLEKKLNHLGFFETTSQKHLAKELKVAIAKGRLIALSGVVGSGKTTHENMLASGCSFHVGVAGLE